jgi:hypothetical protein
MWRPAKGSALDGGATRHAGYAVSQRIRKRIEEMFGWGKTVGPIAKAMLRGAGRVGAQFTFTQPPITLPGCQSCLPYKGPESARRRPIP